MLDINNYIQIFIGLLAILSPFSAIPLFLSMTKTQSGNEQRKTANKTSFAVFCAIVVSVFLGSYILSFFSISIHSFRIAGGILILLMAINMINGQVPRAKNTPEEKLEAKNSDGDISIVPLAIPLLAGPGAISTIIVYSNQGSDIYHNFVLMFIGLLISIIIWITLRMSSKISKFLGTIGINIISRVMGLILASISIEFIINGLTNMLPVLKG